MPAGVNWLLGAPGSGKSTCLRALRSVAPDVCCVELGAWVAPFLGNDGRTPGGEQFLANAVELAREGARRQPQRRFVFATAQIPRGGWPKPTEKTWVVAPAPKALADQRLRRAPRLDASEVVRLDAWLERFLAEGPPHERLSLPFLGTSSSRRPVIGVVGPAGEDARLEMIAQELGGLIVSAGFRLVTGGLGGVMAAVSRGARNSPAFAEGDVVGVLPSYRASSANAFVDVAICTGLQQGRNVVLVASADVVIACGGGAGTLSEIALAWKLGKPVIAIAGTGGWAEELAGRAIDHRRLEEIHGPMSPADAVEAARALALEGEAAQHFD